MESSSSNSEERELQQMQLEERKSHSNYMAWFTELKETDFHREYELQFESITMATYASFVIEGIAIDDNLVAKESTDNSITSLEQLDESSISRNNADADIGPSYDSDTVFKVHHDIFENMFVHGIQNHEQPESIPDTYVVNKNNSNIISDIPNMDPDRNKEEHDYVDNEKQRAFFASLINNLKCDVEKCTNLIVKLSKRMPY
ncbi:hypothetical protein Tco_0559688 [Tanacetum coccineum]